MAPCRSAAAKSIGTGGTSTSAISERRRMNPTWGPLPWVITTFQPAATMSAMWCAVPAAAADWSGIDSCSRSTISELPPTATTAVRSLNAIGLPSRARLSRDLVGKGDHRLGEAGKRRTHDTGADLADSGRAMGDAGIDDRRDPGVDHLARVDPGGRAGEVERRQGERAVAAERDVGHLVGVRDRILRR